MELIRYTFEMHAAGAKENLTEILVPHITNSQRRRIFKSYAGEDNAIGLNNELRISSTTTG